MAEARKRGILRWAVGCGFLVVGSFTADALERFPIKVPDGCHAEMRRTFVYKDKVPIGAFESGGHLESYDVLCIGETISVDQPLRTSGGNITILARKLRLNAPIDTRPYFRRGSVSPHAGLDGAPKTYESAYPQYGVSPGDEALLRQREASAEEVLKYEPPTLALVNDYYTRCADCIKQGSEIWIPELPSGLTPTFINWPLFHLLREVKNVASRSGIPPYTQGLDRVAVQSGDVFAFVEEIETKANLSVPKIAPDPLSCGDQSFQLALLESGGARGGRGGIGQPNECTGDPINRRSYSGLSCVPVVGGANSPGGVGGDAGNVYLRFLTRNEQDMTSQVNVLGGPGGSTSRFVMPRDYTTTNICSYRDGTNNSMPAGRDGRLLVEHVSLKEAWSQVYQIALSLDGLLQHDIKELATEAVNDPRIGSLSFVDFVRSAAHQMRMIGETRLAGQTLNLVYSHYGRPSLVDVPSLWGWQGTDLPADLPEDVRNALVTVDIASSSDAQQNLLRFIEHNGGLLATVTDDAQLEYNLRRIREALGTQIDVQARIRTAIQSIDVRVLEIDLRGSTADAQRNVAEAVRRINEQLTIYQADLARFKAENKEASNMYLDGFVGLFMAGVGGGGGSFNDFQRDFQPSLLKMGKALIRMNSIRPATRPSLLELNRSLFEANETLKRLAVEAAHLRNEARKTYARSLIDALEAKRNSLVELSNRSGLYPDLYKNVWLSFISSPSRNPDLFMRNLAALQDFARGSAVPEDVQLQSPDDGICAGGNVSSSGAASWRHVGECIVAFPSGQRRRLEGIVDGEPRLSTLKLPLVMIAPFTSGQKRFNIRGFSDLNIISVN